jgi:hypothetical protein
MHLQSNTVFCSEFLKEHRLWLMLPSVHDICSYIVNFDLKLQMNLLQYCVLWHFAATTSYTLQDYKEIEIFYIRIQFIKYGFVNFFISLSYCSIWYPSSLWMSSAHSRKTGGNQSWAWTFFSQHRRLGFKSIATNCHKIHEVETL